jgi:two-component system, sensor histidine kinase
MIFENQISIFEAMTLRSQSLKIRFVFAGLVMIAAALLLEPFWLAFAWFAVLVIIQSFDAFTINHLAPNWSEKWRDKVLLTICFFSNWSYGSLSSGLWLTGGVAGQIGAIAFMAAALLHIQNFSYRCAPVFWASVAPYFASFAITTGFELFGGKFSTVEIFAMTLLGVGFCTNLLLAYNHARTMTNNLQAEREAAEAANRAKSDFLATMSHELRTPMNGILGGTELLKRSSPTPDQRDILETLSGAGHALLGLLNDLLDLSKIEAGKMDVEEIPFTPRALVGDMERLWGAAIADKGLTLNIDLADEIPAALIGDPTRLRQILINLLSNAVKFTNVGRIDLTIHAEKNDSDTAIMVIKVADTGIGMSAEAVARVFEPFSQADSSISRRFGGSGLGTVISHRLADLMGGSLSVDSAIGKGTCFTLILPLIGTDNVVLEDDCEKNIEDVSGLRILVAEDHAANRHILARFLEIGGHEVTFTYDGAQAVEAANQQEFDLIILDVRMPVMDGLEALKLIRTSGGANWDQPIIMLSADAMPAEKARGFEMGADDYLTKPIDPRLLFSALAMAKGGRAAFGRVGVETTLGQTA